MCYMYSLVPRWKCKHVLIRICVCASVCVGCQMSLPVGYVAFDSAGAAVASATASNNIADT